MKKVFLYRDLNGEQIDLYFSESQKILINALILQLIVSL